LSYVLIIFFGFIAKDEFNRHCD